MNEASIAGGEKKKSCRCGFMLAIFLVVAAIAAAFVWFYHKAEPIGAQAEVQKWKGFKEERFNFSLRYPISRAFDTEFDPVRYI